MNSIVFTNTVDASDIYAPQPCSKLIPDWYKNTDSYISGEKKPDGKASTTATIKRCMPVFDVMNAGYLLVTHADVWVTQKADLPDNPDKKIAWFEWPSFDVIQFHPETQAPLHPAKTGTPVPKWMNPWSIKTPAGYSTLFIPPVHRDNPFSALPGVVDTDTYIAPVNIVFTLTDPNFEGLVPAGTPIVQVIPFKRDSWEMSIGTEKDLEEQNKIATRLRTKFFDSYKTQFRQVKEYK
jgi:hypothetical protein